MKKPELPNQYILIFLLLLTLYLTFPIWLHPSEFLLRSDGLGSPGDFFLFRSYVVHFQNFFRGTSSLGGLEYGFHPVGMSCADAECSPMFSIPAALLGLAVGPLRALNLFMMLFIFLSGIAMFYLAREFMGEKASIVSATLFMTSNYFLTEMIDGHLNLLQFFWPLLAILFLERMIKKPNMKSALLLGATLAAQAYASTQYLLLLVIILPLYTLFRNYKVLLKKDFWKYILVSAVIFSVLAVPYLMNFLGGQAKERNIQENIFFSVGLPGNTFSYPLLSLRFALKPFSTVFVPVLLFFAGGKLLLSKKMHAWELPFLLLSLIAFVLSLGPISPFAPYAFLYKFFPFFSSMRTPSRFFLFAVISLSLIGGGLASEIEKKVGKMNFKMTTREKISFVPEPVTLALIALIIFSSLFSSLAFGHYTNPPQDYESEGLYEYLGSLPAGTVIEYPNEYHCEYLYHAEIHGQLLFGGCAAFPPRPYYQFVETCGIEVLNIPDPACQGLVLEHNIKYVVYHSEKYAEGFEEFMAQEPRLRLLRKSGQTYLFEVLFDEF